MFMLNCTVCTKLFDDWESRFLYCLFSLTPSITDLVNEAKNKYFKAADILVLFDFKVGWKIEWWWTFDKTCLNHVTTGMVGISKLSFQKLIFIVFFLIHHNNVFLWFSLKRTVFTWAEVACLLEKSQKEDWEHGIFHRDVWINVCDVGHQVGQGPVVAAHVGAAGERKDGILIIRRFIFVIRSFI